MIFWYDWLIRLIYSSDCLYLNLSTLQLLFWQFEVYIHFEFYYSPILRARKYCLLCGTPYRHPSTFIRKRWKILIDFNGKLPVTISLVLKTPSHQTYHTKSWKDRSEWMNNRVSSSIINSIYNPPTPLLKTGSTCRTQPSLPLHSRSIIPFN